MTTKARYTHLIATYFDKQLQRAIGAGKMTDAGRVKFDASRAAFMAKLDAQPESFFTAPHGHEEEMAMFVMRKAAALA